MTKAFISYSHRDEKPLDRLHTHLAMLRREGMISAWYDREILAGDDVDQEVGSNLDGSDIFLALVSPDFLASDYCYEREMTEALKRHEDGSIRIIPIILEPCDWKSSPLGKLKALPKDGKPIEPANSPNEVHHGFSELIKSAGALILNKNRVLLRVRDNDKTALVDVEQGVNYPGGLDFAVIFYSRWRIVCLGLDEHEVICDFTLTKNIDPNSAT